MNVDRLCGLVVIVPGYTTEMYCVSCEVLTNSASELYRPSDRRLSTNPWIYICYIEESRPPLWSSGQFTWLQIHWSGFDSMRYQNFWEVLGLECRPLSLVITTEELLGRKNSGSGLEILDYGRRGSAALTTWHPSPQKLALTLSV
jgi:hypothetical protein